MFITIVRFKLNKISLNEATQLFQKYSAAYIDTPGLKNKHYIYSDNQGGAVYVWESKEDAERLFTTEWHAMMLNRWGGEPRIEWLESPVTV
jgi:hypothetical protein